MPEISCFRVFVFSCLSVLETAGWETIITSFTQSKFGYDLRKYRDVVFVGVRVVKTVDQIRIVIRNERKAIYEGQARNFSEIIAVINIVIRFIKFHSKNSRLIFLHLSI